jgi:hypothetical protein
MAKNHTRFLISAFAALSLAAGATASAAPGTLDYQLPQFGADGRFHFQYFPSSGTGAPPFLPETQTLALAGDATGSASIQSGNLPVTLAASGVTSGTYGETGTTANGYQLVMLVVDAKGRIVQAQNTPVTGDSTVIVNSGTISCSGTLNDSAGVAVDAPNHQLLDTSLTYNPFVDWSGESNANAALSFDDSLNTYVSNVLYVGPPTSLFSASLPALVITNNNTPGVSEGILGLYTSNGGGGDGYAGFCWANDDQNWSLQLRPNTSNAICFHDLNASDAETMAAFPVAQGGYVRFDYGIVLRPMTRPTTHLLDGQMYYDGSDVYIWNASSSTWKQLTN